MNFLRTGLLAGLLTAQVASAATADTVATDQFAWRHAIRGEMRFDELYRVRVPPQVFNVCKAFPADVRIVDDDGREAPFFLWAAMPSEETDVVRVERLRQQMVENAVRYLRQDYRVLPDAARKLPALHNRVVARTPGRDFIRRVEVLGSEDGQDWRLLGSGHLVEQSQETRISNRVITYPATNTPYLQIRIYPNARNAQETITVESLEIHHVSGQPGEWEEFPLKILKTEAEEIKEGVQTLVVDAGARNLPLERLRIRVADDKDFARPVKVYGRNTATNTWRWVADGGIHRMGDLTRDDVPLKGPSYRFMKIDLFQYDASPLRIQSVVAEAVPHYIVFEATGGRLYLYCGSSHYSLPRFDLLRRVGLGAAADAPLVTLGKQEINPQRLARGLRSYGKWLAWLAVGLMSVLVITILAARAKRAAA